MRSSGQFASHDGRGSSLSSQFDFPPCPGALSAKSVSTFCMPHNFHASVFFCAHSLGPRFRPRPLLRAENRRKTEFYDLVVAPLRLTTKIQDSLSVMQREKMEKINCIYMYIYININSLNIQKIKLLYFSNDIFTITLNLIKTIETY